MNKTVKTIALFLFIILQSFISKNHVEAGYFTKCEDIGISIINSADINDLFYNPDRASLPITIGTIGGGNLTDSSYTLHVDNGSGIPEKITMDGKKPSITFNFIKNWIQGSPHASTTFTLRLQANSEIGYTCSFKEKVSISKENDGCEMSFKYKNIENPSCLGNESPIYVSASNIINDNKVYSGPLEIKRESTLKKLASTKTSTPGNMSYTNIGTLEPKTAYRIIIQNGEGGDNLCKETINVEYGCNPTKKDQLVAAKICNSLSEPQKSKCQECMGGVGDSPENKGGVWTGLGCLNFSPSELIKDILQIAIGLGGGIAFLLLIYGAFLMTTSAGNPEAADNAKQIITGAITGLLVIIFSVVILNIIGVQILQIPGL